MKNLEREETNGYWRTSLEVSVCHVSSVAKTQSADADPYGGPSVTTGLRGGSGGGSSWVRPGGRIGDAYDVEYWRFLLPSESFNFCHNLGYAEILLPSLIGYDGTISWSIDPDGPNGTGNPIVFNPSELAPGAYDVVIGIDTLEGTLEKTITLNVRSLSLTSARLVVDATDTSTHYLPIDGNGTFIPDDDDFVVISVPEGIDSIDFIPADLEPGTTYTVDVWNGDCGYVTVTVIAAKIKITPQAEWPDYLRSDLGVGELLNCSATPETASITWSCTEGRAILDNASSASTTLRVLDVPGTLTVTASVDGVPIATNYVIHAPEDIAYSAPWQPVRISEGVAGAGCLLDVIFAPTNVAFYNVWIEEGYCIATNVSGYFSAPGKHPPHDREQGAFNKTHLKHMQNSGYKFTDLISTGEVYPWSTGYMEWHIPATWWISNGLSTTNLHSFGKEWVGSFEIDDQGTATVSKFDSSIKRFIDGRTVPTDSNGVVQP